MKDTEIELKFRIPEKEFGDKILSDLALLQTGDYKQFGRMYITAYYYDTQDYDLYQAGIVYRVRKEGNKTVATVKRGEIPQSNLQQRQEWNVEVCSVVPDLSVFDETDIGLVIKELSAGRELKEIFSCSFERRVLTLRLERNTKAELAVDVGKIYAGGHSEPICELELELKEGDLHSMLELASSISEKYGLLPEPRSKFSRGFFLSGVIPPR